MKNLITILLLLFTCSCYGQGKISETTNQYHLTTYNMKIIRPILTDSLEVLDINKYKELGEVKNEIDYDEYNNDKEYSYTSVRYKNHENGVGYSMFGNNLSGYSSREVADDSYIQIAKGYYPNGKMAIKFLHFNNNQSLRIGREYRYDKEGYLIYAVAADESYDFTFEQVLEYLLGIEKLPLKKGFVYSGDYSAKIKMLKEDAIYIWECIWNYKKYDGEYKEVKLRLNGKTGEVISRTEMDAPLGEE